MAYTRKNIAEAIAGATMSSIISGAKSDLDAQGWKAEDYTACASDVDGCVEVALEKIKVAEKASFIADAVEMFAKSLTTIDADKQADMAVKWRRLLLKRAGEARAISAYINAEIKHGQDAAKRCESFRKVAFMRTAWSTVESDLSDLLAKSNLPGLVACKTSDKGKLVKAKASNATALALENLKNALATRALVVKQGKLIENLKSDLEDAKKPEVKAA